MFLYGLENDIISKTAAEKIMNKLSAQIDTAAELQEKIMRYIAKKSGENTMCPAKALYDALQAGDIRPDGENCFTSVTDNVEFLWIRSDKLTFELNRIYGFEYTSQKYIKYFRRKEILALDKSGEKSTKRHNGRRYLVLRLDILQEVAESIYEDVDALLS